VRPQKDTDFFIDLPGVGSFRYGRRTFGDRAKIRADFLRITKDLGETDPELDAYAAIMAAHKNLCVEAPAGWEDIEALELDSERDAQIFALFDLIREKEETFQAGAKAGS